MLLNKCCISDLKTSHREDFLSFFPCLVCSNFQMEKTSSSWACTIITQLCLCFALYIALNLGHSQILVNNTNAPLDLYFISVNGGFRPFTQQSHLLHKMEKVARTYKASFVVCSSELGGDDPLMQNATQHFPSLRLPWYPTYTTTTASKLEGQEVGCFQQKIKMSNGKTLDVIGVDTELLQDSILRGSLSGNRNNQLHWLIRTLQANSSNWRIVVGSQPLVICGQNKDQMKKKQVFEYLHRIFLKFAVNVYLSGQDCTNHATDGSVAYVGNPGLIEKEPYSVFLNGTSVYSRELANGFLLHRVSSMQIVTHYINSTGEVAFETVLQQKGTEVM